MFTGIVVKGGNTFRRPTTVYASVGLFQLVA
jgi:hypothetical protein